MLASSHKHDTGAHSDFKKGIVAYRHGDFDMALAKWRPLAKDGAVEAQVNLGIMYAKGQGVGRDLGQALEWYRLTADRGHAKAAFNVGVMYENGQAVGQSYDEAAIWYGRAADLGNVAAYYALGLLSQHGRGVPQNANEAVAWFLKAAEKGNLNAQFALAVLLEEDDGVRSDCVRAAQLFTEAAKRGHPPSCYRLARLYEHGRGVERDYAATRQWYEAAAEHNHPKACHGLGQIYLDGKGVPRDDAKALIWFRKAADSEYGNAQCMLGQIYEQGRGVARDPQKAMRWYSMAAAQENPSGCHALGAMYEHGRGIPVDHAEAAACYAKGGEWPTVTDANLVLGYMDAESVIGGALRLDVAAARDVIAPLSAAMGMTMEAAALGVIKVANAALLRALRRVTVERGIDGRGCTLLAFGGAGPMHAVALARTFSIDNVVVPAHSGMFSALGCVGAEMSYAQQRTLRVASDGWDAEGVERVRRALRTTLAAPLAAAGHDDDALTVEEVASIRDRGQSYGIEVAGAIFDDPGRLGRDFWDRHRALYGFATEDPWELVSIRVRVSAPRNGMTYPPVVKTIEAPSPIKTSPCTFEFAGRVPTPRYDRVSLIADSMLSGPVIVYDAWSTVVVPPGATLTADADGHLHIATGVGS